MASHYSSTEDSYSSLDEKEKRFYSPSIPSRQPPYSSSSWESESQSDSPENVLRLPQKKRTPTNPSKPPPSSVKRPRNEDNKSTNNETTKPKPKPIKEKPKKTNADKRKVKKSDPLPSPQKSAKKPIVWNPKEEILILKALAAYRQEGKEFPKNLMTPVYDYVRNHSTLDHEYSNPQLGKKLERLRDKFVVMDDKVKGIGHRFNTTHEETVYKLSKKIWGRQKHEKQPVKEAEVGKGIKGDQTVKKFGQDDEEEEEDEEMSQKESDEVEEEDEEVEINAKQKLASTGMRKCGAAKEALATPNVVSKGTISNGVEDNDHVKLIYQLLKENSVIMNEFKDQLRKEKEPKSDIEKMVRSGLQSSVNGKTSNSIGFSSEEVVKKIYSARELLALDVWEARMLDQKWQRQVIAELEVCSGHLALLQEECQKRMEKLRSFIEDRH